MKLIIIIFFFFTSLNLVAQPGDYGYSKMRFEDLTAKLKADPNNYQLIWERIVLSGFNNTYFDIYKKSGNLKGEISYFTNATELFDDLNKLINNNVVISNHNIAEFKMLTGKLHYFSGEMKQALDDYLFALTYSVPFHDAKLNDKIYISIAAYYYNLEEKLTEENARLTLQYIYRVNPNGCNSNQTPDCYEQEKKELLKFLKEDKKLLEYHKVLIVSEHSSYINVKNGDPETTENIYNTNELYFRTLNRINELAAYYDEIGNHKKSKYLVKQLVKFLPPDNNGTKYTMFPKEKINGIAAEEYSKRFFKSYRSKNYETTWDYQYITAFVESITK